MKIEIMDDNKKWRYSWGNKWEFCHAIYTESKWWEDMDTRKTLMDWLINHYGGKSYGRRYRGYEYIKNSGRIVGLAFNDKKKMMHFMLTWRNVEMDNAIKT